MKKFVLFFFLFSTDMVQAQNLVPYVKDKLWGYCDTKKNIVIKPKYKKVDFFRNGLARVVSAENDKYGIINKKDEVIVPFEYATKKELGTYSQDRIYFQKDQKYGYFDGDGEVIITPQYEFAYTFFKDSPFVPAKKNGKYGIIDKEGNIILEFEHPPMSAIREYGYVSIYTKEGNGVMDLKGNVIVPPKYREKKMHQKDPFPEQKQNFMNIYRKDGSKDNALIFNNGKKLLYYTSVHYFEIDHFFHQDYLLVNIPNLNSFSGAKRALVDINGDPVLIWDNYPYVGAYNDQAVVVGKKKGSDILYGLINLKGETILKPKFDKIEKFDKNGIARFEYKGKTGFINDKGKVVQEEKIFNGVKSFGFSRDGLIYFKGEKASGIMTYKGDVLFNNSDQYNYFFSDYDLIKRKDRISKKEVLVNKSGEILTDEYTSIVERTYGFQINLDNKKGVLGKTGKIIFKAEYQDINFPKEGFFITKKDNLKGLKDLEGKEILVSVYKDIRIIRGSKNFWVKNDQYKWSMINEQGESINDHLYSKVEYFRDGLYNVYLNKWGVVDSDGKEVVPLICKEPLRFIKSDDLLGVIKSGSIIYGYIGKDYTLYWD